MGGWPVAERYWAREPAMNARPGTSGHLAPLPARGKHRIALRTADVLSEREIWSDPGVDVWRSDRFVGRPSFYPVYKYKDYYSHSVINLIAFKNDLLLNEEFIARAQSNPMNYYSGADTIDRDIVRVGGVITSSRTLRSKTEYAERIAEAMKADVSAIEDRYADHQHVVLCGGKDSMNILLLPWKTRLVVLSAAPNYPLVKGFVARHGLPHDVVELKDGDTSTLQAEILYNACLTNLEHGRWTGELKSFVDGHGQKVIVWKGQLADVFTTPHWRSYSLSTNRAAQFYRKHIESLMRRESPGYLEARCFHAAWYRGAMWQGAHMSLLRSVCGALFVSAYHGDAMTKTFSEVDLSAAVTDDIRPLVGKILCGSAVTYPDRNPRPPTSRIRCGVSDPDHFLAAFRRMTDIPIHPG